MIISVLYVSAIAVLVVLSCVALVTNMTNIKSPYDQKIDDDAQEAQMKKLYDKKHK